MAETKYVRITPFNKATGALARRYTIGGSMFVAGKWYALDAKKAQSLARLKQGSGAPVFEVMTEAVFRRTSQRDLERAMTAAGMGGLASAPMSAPEAQAPKTGPQASKFEGLDKSVKEVDLSARADDEASPDFDAMGRDELEELAAEQDVDIPDGASDDDIRDLLRES